MEWIPAILGSWSRWCAPNRLSIWLYRLDSRNSTTPNTKLVQRLGPMAWSRRGQLLLRRPNRHRVFHGRESGWWATDSNVFRVDGLCQKPNSLDQGGLPRKQLRSIFQF